LESECATGVCTRCGQGYESDTESFCNPNLCELYGCGFYSNGLQCTELTDTTYNCRCPFGPTVGVEVDIAEQQGRLDIRLECRAGYKPSVRQIIELLSADNTFTVYIGAFLNRLIDNIYWISVDSVDPDNNNFVLEVEHFGTFDELEQFLILGIAEFFETDEDFVEVTIIVGGTKRQDTSATYVEVSINESVSSGHSLVPFFGLSVALAAMLYQN